MMVSISVILPAYNVAEYIKQSIDSILSQSFRDFELIIINDGSTDSTAEIILQYDDPRIIYVDNEDNKGLVYSLNKGIAMSNGKYIARMDADDVASPDRLETQFRFMEINPETDICGSWMNILENEGKTVGGIRGVVHNPIQLLSKGNFLFHPTILMKRSFLSENKLEYQEYECAEDYKLWLEAAKKGANFYVIPEPLLSYRFSTSQTSNSKKQIQTVTAARIQKEAFDFRSQYETNLFIMDISNPNMASGVNRYVEVLTEGLKPYKGIIIHRIKFLSTDKPVTFISDEGEGNYTVGYNFKSHILLNKHCSFMFDLMKELFDNKPNIVLHLHTLNLIDYALYIKSRIPCKIVSHLHCIPWKGLYNSRKSVFNDLYKKQLEGIKGNGYFIQDCEVKSYKESDKLVCVTQMGQQFVKENAGVESDFIPNGIKDYGDVYQREAKTEKDHFELLFVGSLSPGKGISFILDAVQKIQSLGYSVSLNVAASYNEALYKYISQKYSSLKINLLGRVPFPELMEYYKKSDMGIIASMQEQCSYVAIEMAMFGLPIITTAIDGLDEMFTDRGNALKITPVFSENFGLYLDSNILADKIIELIRNPELRNTLGLNARKLYLGNYTAEKMISRTVDIYENLKHPGNE